MIAGPDDYTLTEAARRADETRSFIRARLDDGTLERVWDKTACEWRISKASVDRYIAERDAEEPISVLLCGDCRDQPIVNLPDHRFPGGWRLDRSNIFALLSDERCDVCGRQPRTSHHRYRMEARRTAAAKVEQAPMATSAAGEAAWLRAASAGTRAAMADLPPRGGMTRADKPGPYRVPSPLARRAMTSKVELPDARRPPQP